MCTLCIRIKGSILHLREVSGRTCKRLRRYGVDSKLLQYNVKRGIISAKLKIGLLLFILSYCNNFLAEKLNG